MKDESIQLEMRENTASSRRRASQPSTAAALRQFDSSRSFGSSKGPTHDPNLSTSETFELSIADSDKGNTVEATTLPHQLRKEATGYLSSGR
jgi:hypothetical protein